MGTIRAAAFSVDAVCRRWRRRCLCDMLLTVAMACGAFWYAGLLPDGALKTGMLVIGWWMIGVLGLLAVSAICEALVALLPERGRDSGTS